MSLTIRIKVIPGARQDSIEQFAGLLKIKVRSPPEKGRANAAVQALLASFLALKPDQVQVVAGHTSALKTVRLDEISQPALDARLADLKAARQARL